MQAGELIKKYLREKQVMQLATVKNGQPWVCNLHFVADENNVLYWISKNSRRHSQEIAADSKAAAAIMVSGPEHPVIGIQIEGDAVQVTDKQELEKAMKRYDAKHEVSQDFYEKVLSGTAPEFLYKLTPRLIVLFDEQNFPDNPRQEWRSGEAQ